MSEKQLKIRDFGEKIRYLVGTRGKPELWDDFQEELPPEFRCFRTAAAFASHLNVDEATLSQWRDDNRNCGYRLAPKVEDAEKVARLFGIWSKNVRSDPRPFWQQNWPSWYSGEASDQYKKGYKRPGVGDAKPDSLEAFQKAYCAALRMHIDAPENSNLYFTIVKDHQSRRLAAQDLIRIIRKAPQILEVVQRQPGMGSMPARVLSDGSIDSDTIAPAIDWLLDAKIDTVINACQQAYSEISDEEHISSGAVLTELAQRIVPALYDHYSVSKIKSALGEEIGAFVELPVHHRTVADVIVAAAETRPTSYHPRKKREDWPIPARSFIDQTPDNGFDAHVQRTKDVQNQLAKCFTAPNTDDIYAAVRDYVAGGPFYRPEPGTDFAEEEKFELAGEIIRQRMKFERKCFYMIFYLPEAKDDHVALSALVDRLKKKLPGMLFLALDKKASVAKAEIRRFGPFIWMLPAEEGDGGRS